MKRKFVLGTPPPADQPQRQPTPQQIDAAQRILSHDHQRTYGEGAKGATIRALQIYLASKGYEPGRFDGDWGAKTEAAFKAYNADRGQSFARATPEALAQMSAEAGQPLPRQRPAQPTDDMAASAAAQPGLGPTPDMAMTGDASPKAPPFLPSPSAPHAVEREYDPNVMHAAAMNRDEPADMASDPTQGYQSPIISPDPNRFGPEMGDLARMQPGSASQLPPMRPNPKFDPPVSRFAEETQPATSDIGVPDRLIEAMPHHPVNPLRDALINGGGQAFTQDPRYEALRQALIARMVGR